MGGCVIRAAVLTRPGTIEIRQFDPINPRDDDATLAVELAGVCGTDYHLFNGDIDAPLPLVLGHEIVGRIARIGKGAAEHWGVAAGDLVVVESTVPCARCAWCRKGIYKYCSNRMGYGTTTSSDVAPHLWGAMADEMYLAPGSIVHPIPDGVSTEVAVLASIVANAVSWTVEVGRAGPGVSVVVRGDGAHGMACVAVARHAGADAVVLIGRDSDDRRHKLAQELGADGVLLAGEGEALTVRERVGDPGPDLVIDASGDADAFQADLDLLPPQGRLIWAGLSGRSSTVGLDRLVWNDIEVRGVFEKSAGSYRTALKLLQHKEIPFHKMVSTTFPLERVSEALEMMGPRQPDRPIRAVIKPGPES
jgi:alcohol dehydrogenase